LRLVIYATKPESECRLPATAARHAQDSVADWKTWPEGNRRLVALKALENPDSLVGAVDNDVLNQLRDLSRTYQTAPIKSVLCYCVKDRDEARPWIELRHTGENEGAGIVRWGSDESSRFRARNGQEEIHTIALNFWIKMDT
jgi:hypothetical protein